LAIIDFDIGDGKGTGIVFQEARYAASVLSVVRDEDAFHIQLDTAAFVAIPQIERREPGCTAIVVAATFDAMRQR
jgi:hypothetical protein